MLLTVANIWNQPRHPSLDKQIFKMWYEYIIEYYLDMKKNESLTFTRKWTKLKIRMLSKMNKKQKDKYMFSLICESLKSRSELRIVIMRSLERWGEEGGRLDSG